MTAQVCLLRGINVGGRNSLKMADLRHILGDLGATDVATYIQSGNAVYRGTLEPKAVSAAIAQKTGFAPHALILDAGAYAAILDANPFVGQDGVHVFFCDGRPVPISDDLRALAAPSENVAIVNDMAFLLAPDGIGRSKLAARMDKALGVPVTARNWKTACKLRAMTNGLA